METQRLIDLCYELVVTATNPLFYEQNLAGKKMEERAAWVRDQLDKCGFKGTTCPSHWILDENHGNRNGETDLGRG